MNKVFFSKIKSYKVIIGVLSLLLIACDGAGKNTSAKNDDYVSSILGYNHTDDYIHKLYINGAMGANLPAHGGGGAITCCVTLPQPWHKDLRVKIEWATSRDEKTIWHEKAILPPKYGLQEGGLFQLHFLPNLEVLIVISNLYAEHPDYPGPKHKYK